MFDFLVPLTEVVGQIYGWNVKVLVDKGSTGNYINDTLLLLLEGRRFQRRTSSARNGVQEHNRGASVRIMFVG